MFQWPGYIYISRILHTFSPLRCPMNNTDHALIRQVIGALRHTEREGTRYVKLTIELADKLADALEESLKETPYSPSRGGKP
jgi:hypothetical protein